MKIIIDLMDNLSTDAQLIAVAQYIKKYKVNGVIKPTPKDSAFKMYLEEYNPVHVLCKINKQSVYFKTWRGI